MRSVLLSSLLILSSLFLLAQSSGLPMTEDEYKHFIDSINHSFKFEHGRIQIADEAACIQVPDGYKFLNQKQSRYVLCDLWGNPPSHVLGMLFPENYNPLDSCLSFAIEITYSQEGFINDEDAKYLDYKSLLQEMQEDSRTLNIERKALGYPEVNLIGWAFAPFYDAEKKKLHWAKELSFEGDTLSTFNYNIRILGRKGYLNVNAIGNMDVLPLFQKDADKILSSLEFNKGYRYSEFKPNVDKMATYGIGGLIAGKEFHKANFFSEISKFWKVLLICFLAILIALKKIVFPYQKQDHN